MRPRTGLLALALVSGCIGDEPIEATSQASQASFVTLGWIGQNGMGVTFEDVTGITGIDMSRVVGLTACDETALYAVERYVGRPPWGLTSYHLLFSNDSGQSWKTLPTSVVAPDGTSLSTLGKSAEIACDHAMLVTLDASKHLWYAPLQNNGTIGITKHGGTQTEFPWYTTWQKAPTTVQVDRIQGGDGSFYGVKAVARGRDVYIASNRAAGVVPDWGTPVANIGAMQVTGTGATHTGSDNRTVADSLAWSRRAYALELDGRISMNSTLLDGQNWWTGFDTGSERYTTLTAATPNVLFGIQNKGGVNHLNRIRITETSCFDGIDNDANGLKDSEDPACRQVVANTFCNSHVNGYYCANRFQPGTFLDQPNQNTSLVECVNHNAYKITPGVCEQVQPGQDRLLSADDLTPPDPPNTSHYCNVHYPDGSWDFDFGYATPCTKLLNNPNKPGGKIVRAGLYSTVGANNVYVRCSDGSFGPEGAAGYQPLLDAYAAVGHNTNACIFQVTATDLPLFAPFFNLGDQLPYPGRVTNPFTHGFRFFDLAQFGNGQTGTTNGVDRFGNKTGAREGAYDHPIDEGRPLYAPAGGVVVPNGSRIRPIDIPAFTCGGTPNQGELWIKYSIGSDPVYRESFIVGYMHVRKRLVEDNQTVKTGQIVGYVGAAGCTGGYAHLHSSVARVSNVNAHKPGQPEYGYRFPFSPTLDPTGSNEGGFTAIDALGWANYNAFDPGAYLDFDSPAINSFSNYGFVGLGAWSVNLFKPGAAFRYP